MGRRRIGIIGIVLVILIFSAGYLVGNKVMKRNDEELVNKSKVLDMELKEMSGKLEGLETKDAKGKLIINYEKYPFTKRFIAKRLNVLGMADASAMVLNYIDVNSVVRVIDAAMVGKSESAIVDRWLYVEIPVYNSPSNTKGWIRESDTVEYTKDKISLVQGEIRIKSTGSVYETEEFNNIRVTVPHLPSEGLRGRIILKKSGYAKVSCPGKKIVWVGEKDIVYPGLK